MEIKLACPTRNDDCISTVVVVRNTLCGYIRNSLAIRVEYREPDDRTDDIAHCLKDTICDPRLPTKPHMVVQGSAKTIPNPIFQLISTTSTPTQIQPAAVPTCKYIV